MADIFREVDEEVRRDKAAEFWSKYQNWIIALVVVILAATGGWRYYEYQRRIAAEEAGAKFQSATQLAQQGKVKEAEGAFEQIAKAGAAGYAVLARLRAAAEAGAQDKDQGIKAFDAIGADTTIDKTFRDLARLRAAVLAVDKVSLDEARKRLEPLAAADGIYRHTARELLALAAFKADDFEMASRWLDNIIVDAETPGSVRQRATTLQALVVAGKPAK
jgi:hypothetical protein